MRDIFCNKTCQRWAEWCLIVLLVDYLLLFGAEAILPGFVMTVFNLNYLLVIILLLVTFLVGARTGEVAVSKIKYSYWLVGLGWVFLFVVGIFSLYKVAKWQIGVYLFFSVICFAFIHRYIRRQE